MLGLLLLFLFHVLAQMIQLVAPVAVLPPFHAWQSGALPYPVLVGVQVLILAGAARVVWTFLSGSLVLSPKLGRLLLSIGWAYCAVMGIRLLIGLAIAPTHFWFGATLPTLFHLVFASFLLVWGMFHATYGGRPSLDVGGPVRVVAFIRYTAYPVVLLSCVIGNMMLLREGAGVLLATYVPVTVGTLVVMGCERTLPYRPEWRPSWLEAAQDSRYVVRVHVLLPKALGVAVVVFLFAWVDGQRWPIAFWWPKDWPVLAQTVLMVVLVDGVRYWLHRLSHEQEFLWRFHAVHHASQRSTR